MCYTHLQCPLQKKSGFMNIVCGYITFCHFLVGTLALKNGWKLTESFIISPVRSLELGYEFRLR